MPTKLGNADLTHPMYGGPIAGARSRVEQDRHGFDGVISMPASRA